MTGAVTIEADALKIALTEYQKRDAEQPRPVDYPLVCAIIAYLKAVKSPPPPPESCPGEGRGLREALDESALALKWAATVIRPGSDLRDAMDAALAKAE